ncbi:PREDICTED: MAP7 domain-containing protein 1-like isoform X5 [Dinoponera quadriceps]|uniref:MAP7 domain-containing protein 1-like isoform X5 n=1 Tax=Dinoponera quadriceps TaxID=609295 RepID=A0A6P3XF30_DINQU|nr:PREDICTED: MAP7 domain-containing protein 1-like isoform X5 [Dinoponera quadriceps]
MFSELCRETLRKAAVCYSSARAGSPSPSPPTSPPPSPAKEAKTAANADLANVRDAGHEGARDHQHHSGTSGRRVSPGGNAAGESRDPAAERSTTDRSNDVREYVYVRKRPAMPTDFSKRLPGLEAREGRRGTCVVDPRESRSVSPEKGRQQHEDNNRGGSGGGGGGNGGGAGECGRPDSRLGRRSPGSSPEPEDNSSTSGDEAGAAPEETNQRSSSAHNRHSLTKEQTMHWFAQIGVDDDDALALSDVKRRRSLYDEDSLDGDRPYENEGRDSTGSSKELDRAKLVRERQNEERQRKLEELRQQALAAQRFREQREEERRRRIDELRSRDNDRRNQVEERKRLICEAERERREAILRKNQEREARIEAKKKNERSHIVFAFGSSTPRMLEPADTGGSTFWGTRRATSTTNVMMFSAAQPLTRRSSERELDGSKKRATSAGGLDRKPGEDMRMSSSMYEVFNWNSSPDPPLTPAKHKRASLSLPPTTDIFAVDDKSDSDTRRPMIQRAASGEENDGTTPSTPSSVYLRVNRRRTDLMPTIPSPRDGPPSTARSSSAKAFTRSPGIRSGEVTPNSPSRPHSSMSQQSASSVGSSNVNLRSRTAASRRPRPASIAGTGVSVTEKHNLVGDVKLTKDSKPPLPKVHSTPKKPSTPKATEVKKPTEKLIKNVKSSPRITPKATPLQSPGAEHAPLIRESTVEIIKQIDEKDTQDVKSEDKNEEKKDQGSEKIQPQESNIIESITEDTKMAEEQSVPVSASKQVKDETNLLQENLLSAVTEEPPKAVKKEENKQEKKPTEISEVKPESEVDEQIDMSASMIAKIRITTEEEAKAALAERRRLAREQAEREAELERQRKEEEARLEAERLRAEEEEQRRLEEETLRLANEAREAEEQRLRLAIEEAKRREEEDRRRREEEARQKQEKEEAERKAREEAERQRIEMSERLKKEEEERNARRKRVEAIMLRTRGKNQSNTPTKGEAGDGDKLKEESPSDENKPVPGSKGDDVMTASLISEATEQFISGEQRAHQVENDAAPDIVHNGTHSNGINESKIVLDNNQGNVEGELNGHHTNHGNGINSQSITLDNATVKQNNVTNNLLDLSEFDTLSNNSSGYDTGPILELTPNLANEDSLNSNLNPTAMPFTPMGNTFVPATANANVNPFQDNFISNKPQDNNQVPDLLS